MNEPLFPTSAPNWTALPPAFGWIQPGLGTRPAPLGASGFSALQSAQPGQQGTTGALPTVQTTMAHYPPMYASNPQPFGLPTSLAMGQPGVLFSPPVFVAPGPYGMSGISQEVPIALAAPSLLAAVATRRGQPMGPTNDQELEEFIYDVLELLPGANEVEVRCEGGRATLTGSVHHKRMKHDFGEIVWAIPHIADVQNNLTIATRRRSRSAGREGETLATPAGRKQT
jgi:hypothetical protein